jgi:hypothetical protein
MRCAGGGKAGDPPQANAADARARERLDGFRHEVTMTWASHPVQDHPGDFYARVEAGAALDDRRRGLRLPAGVEHEQDRPAERRRDIGGRTGPARLSHYSVEKPHNAFAEDKVASLASGNCQSAEKSGRHRPTVQIEAWFACRGGMKGRVDIIRPAFCAGHREARIPVRAHEPKGQHGLAATRARRGDNKTAC